MRLRHCHNFHDFRRLAKRRLPGPIFDYIDGAADDEMTHRRNTASFERCDLVPNVLRGVDQVDLTVTVMGQTLAMPVYCSPVALQRLFHHQGERAVAAAAATYGTIFGVSSLGTVSLEELRKAYDTPQLYQFYFHKDRGLNRSMLERATSSCHVVAMTFSRDFCSVSVDVILFLALLTGFYQNNLGRHFFVVSNTDQTFPACHHYHHLQNPVIGQ